MIKIANALNFIRSAMAPVSRRGVITANIISKLANRTPGIVGAKLTGLLDETWWRKAQSRLPINPLISGPNVTLKPKVNHITLKTASPKKICIKIETVFFLLSKPDSNRPRAGIMRRTSEDAISIHDVSPESIGMKNSDSNLV
jgi:hypothetical protein